MTTDAEKLVEMVCKDHYGENWETFDEAWRERLRPPFRDAVQIVVEECAKAANVFPRGTAHACFGENSDLYRAQEYACALAVYRILALAPADRTKGEEG